MKPVLEPVFDAFGMRSIFQDTLEKNTRDQNRSLSPEWSAVVSLLLALAHMAH